MREIIGLVHDVSKDRWHPIVFGWHPAPSESHTASREAARYKSRAHHTAGFATKEQAHEGAEELARLMEPRYGKPILLLEKAFPWDGEGAPAIVAWFIVDADTAQLVLC